jgi:hypothetical protein
LAASFFSKSISFRQDQCRRPAPDTAANFMKASALAVRFRNVRNLKLARTTIYDLAEHDNEDDLPAIISELEKHATKKKMKVRDAERIHICCARRACAVCHRSARPGDPQH